jgi:hypothetical protein
MPNSGVRPGKPRDPKLEPVYSQKDLDDAIRVAKLEQATHDVKGVQQHRLAAEVLTAKVQAPAVTQQRMAMFQTVISIVGGTVGIGVVAIAAINTYANSQAQGRESAARMASLESWRTLMVAMNLPPRYATSKT